MDEGEEMMKMWEENGIVGNEKCESGIKGKKRSDNRKKEK